MKNSFLPSSLLALASLAFLTACETQMGATTQQEPAKPAAGTPPKPPTATSVTPTPVVPPQPSAEQVALREGIEAYNKGDFNDAIKRLSSSDISNGSKASQLSALKYTAFSYCVTNRATLCRQTFEKAFKLDPSFDLAPGEHGHPMWGKAFQRAKNPPATKK